MPPLIFGRKGQINFNSVNEFYESLGFLAKNDGTTSLHWENNELQGAWGSEGRIHCYQNIANFPRYFSNAFTAGTGRVLHRINCNQYVQYIRYNHHFVLGRVNQNQNTIRNSITPQQYRADFDRGLTL